MPQPSAFGYGRRSSIGPKREDEVIRDVLEVLETEFTREALVDFMLHRMAERN